MEALQTSMDMDVTLSIVIPAYNEEKRLGSTLEQLQGYVNLQPMAYEIIVVDDGSTDKTAEIVRSAMASNPHIRLIRNIHSGKSYAVRTGIFAARGGYCLLADADLSTPPREFGKLVAPLIQGFDLAIGWRSGRRKAPWYRKFMSLGWIMLVNIVGVHGFHDTQCGFRAYRTDAARDLLRRVLLYNTPARCLTHASVNAGSDIEVLFVAKTLGYKIAEVPIEWVYSPNTRVNPIQDSLQAFMDLLKIRWHAILGSYNRSVLPKGEGIIPVIREDKL